MAEETMVVKAAAKIPKFGNGDIPRDFLLKVEQAVTANKWSDRDTAAQVILALDGKPLTWIRAIKDADNSRAEEDKIAESWKKLKPAFH